MNPDMSSPSSANPNGTPGSPVPSGPASLGRLVKLLSPMPVKADQLGRFGTLPGADEDPWDVMLTTMALDEHTALETLAKRLGIPYEAEPKSHESAEVFYERVPGAAARRHHIAGLRASDSGSGSLLIATAQPMQPAVFSMLERVLGMPVEIVLSPRAAVGDLINRGYEQRQDLVTRSSKTSPSTSPRSNPPRVRSPAQPI